MSNAMLFLYIDPGTGAMLFTTILGLITTLSFALRKQYMKVKFYLTGGRGKGRLSDYEKMDYVIFSDDKRYWNVFKPICDEFESRRMECHYYTASEDDPALSEDYAHVKCTFIGHGNSAYAKLNVLNARICLSTTPGLDVYQWKRSKNTNCYVHIMHEVGGIVHYRMFGIDYYDALLTSGKGLESEIRELEEIRNLPQKEVQIVGSTYMDELLKKHEAYKHDCNKDTKTVLIAPSWGEISLFNRFGEKLLDQFYASDYNVIVRPHPQSFTSEKELLDSLMQKYPEKGNWKWNRDNNNFDALESSDIMISDYSGIICDYALVFDKPVIYANTDIDNSQYDACWIDHPTLRDEVLSKIGKSFDEKDLPNLCDIVNEMLTAESVSEKRNEIKQLCWNNIGQAAKAAVDWLVKKNSRLKEEN